MQHVPLLFFETLAASLSVADLSIIENKFSRSSLNRLLLNQRSNRQSYSAFIYFGVKDGVVERFVLFMRGRDRLSFDEMRKVDRRFARITELRIRELSSTHRRYAQLLSEGILNFILSLLSHDSKRDVNLYKLKTAKAFADDQISKIPLTDVTFPANSPECQELWNRHLDYGRIRYAKVSHFHDCPETMNSLLLELIKQPQLQFFKACKMEEVTDNLLKALIERWMGNSLKFAIEGDHRLNQREIESLAETFGGDPLDGEFTMKHAGQNSILRCYLIDAWNGYSDGVSLETDGYL